MLQLEHTDMNLEKKLSAIKAETVAANARVAPTNTSFSS